MFRVVSGTDHEPHFEGHDEGDALYVAVRRTTLTGEDHEVQDDRGEIRWYAEADTKVDDADPTYPCIVHWRGEND